MKKLCDIFLEIYRERVAEVLTQQKGSRIAIVLGSTTDGFGRTYEVLQKAMAHGGFLEKFASRIDLQGMMSSEGIKYGIQYKSVSSHLNHNAVLETMTEAYANEKGQMEVTQSWVTKTSELALDETIRRIVDSRANVRIQEVVEGGGQSVDEGIKLLAEAQARRVPVQIRLVVGVETSDRLKDRAKDKGPRAASLMALAVHQYGLLEANSSVQVTVEDLRVTGVNGKPLVFDSVEKFLAEAQRADSSYRKALASWQAELPAERRSLTVQDRIRFGESVEAIEADLKSNSSLEALEREASLRALAEYQKLGQRVQKNLTALVSVSGAAAAVKKLSERVLAGIEKAGKFTELKLEVAQAPQRTSVLSRIMKATGRGQGVTALTEAKARTPKIKK